MVCSVDVVPSVVCPRVVCSVDVGSGEGTKRVVESEEGTKRVSVIIAVLDAVVVCGKDVGPEVDC